MQQRDGGSCLRTKAAGRDIGGSFGGGQLATAWAADGMILMCGDERAHEWQLPHVLDAHGTGVRQGGV